MMNKLTQTLTMVLSCLAVGYLSGIVTRSAIIDWYPYIQKPSFNPPNWVFAPVWSTLYAMMGVAAALVWHKIESARNNVTIALRYFAIQLGLNALWSYLFFGLHNPLLAALEIVVLWLMIYETYLKFKPINKISALLLIPYLAWVGFATILNWSIWWLNQ
jgi:translocator protein